MRCAPVTLRAGELIHHSAKGAQLSTGRCSSLRHLSLRRLEGILRQPAGPPPRRLPPTPSHRRIRKIKRGTPHASAVVGGPCHRGGVLAGITGEVHAGWTNEGKELPISDLATAEVTAVPTMVG